MFQLETESNLPSVSLSYHMTNSNAKNAHSFIQELASVLW